MQQQHTPRLMFDYWIFLLFRPRLHTDSTGLPAIVGPNQMDGKYSLDLAGWQSSYVSFRLTLEHSNAGLWTMVRTGQLLVSCTLADEHEWMPM